MKIEAIRSFVKLVESGSYAVAAEELYMSPTTLHSHVKAIQGELNAKLVTFDGRRLDLTNAGHQFLLFASRTIQEYDALVDATSRISRPAQTRIRISSMHAPSLHILPPLMEAFHRERPEVVFTTESGTVGDAVASLTGRQADIAIMYEGSAARLADLFHVTPIYRDHLTAMIRKDFYTVPDMELMEHVPIAAQPASTSSRQYLERWAREHGLSIRVPFEHASSDAILAQVLSGPSIGVLSSYVANLSPAAGLIRELNLPDFPQDRSVVAVHARTAPSVVNDFVDMCARLSGSHAGLADAS